MAKPTCPEMITTLKSQADRLLTFSPFPEDALDLGRGGGLRSVEELSMSLLLRRVELRERAEIGKIHPYYRTLFQFFNSLST